MLRTYRELLFRKACDMFDKLMSEVPFISVTTFSYLKKHFSFKRLKPPLACLFFFKDLSIFDMIVT